jgi:hypothetical protein
MSEVMTDKGTSFGTLINLTLTLSLGVATPYLISGYLFFAFGGFSVLVNIISTLYNDYFSAVFSVYSF